MSTSHQFETIFENANEAIVISDNKGLISRINPAGVKLFGYDMEELIGKRIELLIPKRHHKNHEKLREKYHESPKNRAMGSGNGLFAEKKNGDEFPVEVSLSPCELGDRKMVVAFVIDITERKKVEEQSENYQKKLEQEVEDRTLILKEAVSNLENTKRRLDQSLKKERELNQLKTNFVSTASHEFRTPLATIMSSLSLVEKYYELGQKEKGEKHIHRIKKSVKNLTEILDDILNVNKIEEGKVLVCPEIFELVSFLRDILSEVGLIVKKGQVLESNLSKFRYMQVNQDYKLLRHILLNLLSNAIKFSEPGKFIKLSLSDDINDFTLKIKDEGIGIPEQDFENLFTRFFRSKNVEEIQGTGLGLSIVKEYTYLLKGKVSYRSKVGQGTEFTISLPKEL